MAKKQEIEKSYTVVVQAGTGEELHYQPKYQGNLVDLTDLWRRHGSVETKHPRIWRRQVSTRQLIDSLADKLKCNSSTLLSVTKGRNGGTWGHVDLATQYLQYLSPKAQLLVSEIVRERFEEEANPELAIQRGLERARNQYERFGYSRAWIDARLRGIGTRNNFTSELAKHGVEKWGFGACTNAIYRQVLGGDVHELKKDKNLPAKANLRDHMKSVELSGIDFAEELAKEAVNRKQAWGNHACVELSHKAGGVIKNAMKEMLDNL